MSLESGVNSQPGFFERFSYVSRNIEMVLAGIAVAAGSLGAAALLGLGAFIDHSAGGYFKNQRLKQTTSK